jgi:hypothetical protein
MMETALAPKPKEELVPTPFPDPAEETRLELEAQALDMEKARAEAWEAGQNPDGDYVITEGLPVPFFFVRRYRGVGPLAYETKRGLIKVNSGDIIAGFYYHEHDADGNDLEEQLEEVIVMTEAAFMALQDDFGPDQIPEALDVRAVNIGNARRGPSPTPPIAETKPPKPDQGLPGVKPPVAGQLPTPPPQPTPYKK